MPVIFRPQRKFKKLCGSQRILRKALVIRLDNMGDVILLTPFLECFKSNYPDCSISVLLRPASAPALENNPRFDNIIVHNPPWGTGNRGARKIHSGFASIIKYASYMPNYLYLLMQLRKEKFDIAFDARGDFRNIFLYGYLSGSKEIIGYDRTGGSKFLSTHLSFDYNKSEIENNLDLLKALGADTRDYKKVKLYPGARDEAYVGNLLAEMNISAEDFSVCISPGAKIIQRWPEQKIAALINTLAEKYGAQILISGTRDEYGLARQIAAMSKKDVHVLTGKLTILQFTALLKRISLFICMDTGALHVAGATEVPTICLFGPTSSKRFGHDNVIPIQKRQPCFPILHESCQKIPGSIYGECINLIEVKDIVEKIDKLRQARA